MKRAGRLWRRITGRDPGLVAERRTVATLTLGSEYGAHTVCPDGLSPASVVYSCGVGEDVSFDLALIQRFGLTVHAFDPTPRAIAWVKAQTLPAGFVLHEVAVADRDGTARFHPPLDDRHVSHTLLDRPETAGRAIEVPVRRLSTLLAELGHRALDVLKLDVEGGEYVVLDDLLTSRIEVRQILVEFHHQLAAGGARRTRRAAARLRRAGYLLFHVSESGHECSFLRG